MTYSALEVARYIIHHEAQQGRTVSNLRLQKLLYFVQVQFVVNGHDALLFEKFIMNIGIMAVL